MLRKRSFVSTLMTILVISAALLLPFSGLTPESSAAPASDSSLSPFVAASPAEGLGSEAGAEEGSAAEPATVSAPASGTVSPSSGPALGGTFVAVELGEAPALVGSAHGDGFGLAVTSDGDVVTWGLGEFGVLGNGAATTSLTPVLLSTYSFDDDAVTQVAAGSATAYALTDSGRLFSWGAGDLGQTGTGASSAVPVGVDPQMFDSPVEQVTAGGSRGYALTEMGSVFAWGANASPVQLPLSEPASHISAAGDHLAVLTAAGQVFTAGFVGDGFSVLEGSLEDTVALDSQVTQVGVAANTFVAMTASGALVSWVLGGEPQVAEGLPSVDDFAVGPDSNGYATFVALSGASLYQGVLGEAPSALDLGALTTGTPTAVSAGNGAFFVLAGGALYGWGEAHGGQLGTGSDQASPGPVLGVNFWPTEVLFDGVPGEGLAATSPTNLGVVSPSGEPGTTEVDVRFTLRAGEVAGADTVGRVLQEAFTYEGNEDEDEGDQQSGAGEEIAALGEHSFETMGSKAARGTSTGTLSPSTGTIYGADVTRVEVDGLPEFTQVSSGTSHTLALTDQGEVFAWGKNDVGQLGDGSIDGSSTPVKVALPDGVEVTEVSAGDNHSLALTDSDTDNKVLAWGGNGNGQLGSGNTAGQETPAYVKDLVGSGDLTGVTQISAGGSFSLALTDDTKVLAWGANNDGGLGNGITTESTLPTAVLTAASTDLASITQISAGSAHSLAIGSAGAVWAWGDDASGQLGVDRTATNGYAAQVWATGETTGTTKLSGVTAVSAGGTHSLALTENNEVLAWGNNNDGQLGDGTKTEKSVPTAVSRGLGSALENKTVTQVSAGDSFSLALDDAGHAYSWGANADGQLGNESNTESSVPVVVSTTSPSALEGINLGRVDAGSGSAFGVGDQGSVYSWGSNADGELGNGKEGASQNSNVPVLSANVTGISAITFDGVGAYSFLLGTTPGSARVRTPAHGEGKVDVAVHFGVFGGDAAGSSSTVTFEQAFEYKKISRGTMEGGLSPTEGSVTGGTEVQFDPVTLPRFVQVSSGGGHTLALCDEGNVYAWGSNTSGQLGNESNADSPVPIRVKRSFFNDGVQAPTIIQVSAGNGFSLALRHDGKLFAWGKNTSGQLGNNLTSDSDKPVVVETTVLGGATFAQVSAGKDHSVALSSTGDAYAWGDNASGQLGNGDGGPGKHSAVPVQVKSVADEGSSALPQGSVVQMAAGGNFSMALSTNGEVYTWGDGTNGRLGNGDDNNEASAVPVKVTTDAESDSVLPPGATAQVAAGLEHGLALASGGRVYSWGHNGAGELGNNSNADSNVPVAVKVTGEDGSVLPPGSVLAVSAGDDFSTATALNGRAYAWGKNASGQLGYNNTQNSKVPVEVKMAGTASSTLPLGSITQISAGGAHNLAVSTNGRLYAWGANTYGELGNGEAGPGKYSTVPITSVNARATSVTFGGLGVDAFTTAERSGVLTATTSFHGRGETDVVIHTSVYAGLTPSGLIMPALTFADGFEFIPVDQPSGTLDPDEGFVMGGEETTLSLTNAPGFLQVSSSATHTLALSTERRIYAWGDNGSGQLGAVSPTESPVPLLVDIQDGPDDVHFMQVAAGKNFSLGLSADGEVYAWGSQADGRLGNGATSGTVTDPVKITGAFGGKKIIQIAAGDGHALALTADGKVYVWGKNGQGQLGDNSQVDRSTPVAVYEVENTGQTSDRKAIRVAAGGDFSLVLSEGGLPYSTGSNSKGQLGRATGPDNFSQVFGFVDTTETSALHGKTVVQLAAGNAHALALGSDTRVYAWGDNANGQLGDGTNAQGDSPVLVVVPDGGSTTPLRRVTSIAAGQDHSLSEMSDGKVKAWGSNSSGQLGVASPTESSTPIDVNANGGSALKGQSVVAVAAGNAFSVALGKNGRLYAWGDNTSDQLGGGSTAPTSSSSPLLSGHFEVTDVKFDGTSGTDLAETETGATINTPPHAAAQVDVTVDFAAFGGETEGNSGPNPLTLDGAYTYREPPPPTADLLTNSGSVLGGNEAQLKVTDMQEGVSVSAVLFGGYPAIPLAYEESTGILTVTAPPHVVGAVDVTLFFTADPLDALYDHIPSHTINGGYRYLLPDVEENRVDPNFGPEGGGTPATITAGGFTDGFLYTAGGQGFGLGLTRTGEVYAWGDNASGQLGNGSTTESLLPVKVEIPEGKKVVQISAGDATGYAVTEDGLVYAWGKNDKGQLGNGNTTNALSPVLVVKDSSVIGDRKIIRVEAGKDFALAIGTGGPMDYQPYAWGNNEKGQLGNGLSGANAFSAVPVAVTRDGGSSLSSDCVVGVAAGGETGYALTANGKVHAWGAGELGQLGNGDSPTAPQVTPVAVDTGSSSALEGKVVSALAAGAATGYALDGDGNVYAWGEGDLGQLGNGNNTASNVPVAVDATGISALSGKRVSRVTASGGSAYAVARSASNEVSIVAWGVGTDGQLGNGASSNQNVPVTVIAGARPADQAPVTVGAGPTAGYISAANGRIYAFGNQTDGALGNNVTTGTTATPALGPNYGVNPATSVKFGQNPATAVSPDPVTDKIAATTPAGTPGPVDVTVQYIVNAGTAGVGSVNGPQVVMRDAFIYGPTPQQPAQAWQEGFEPNVNTPNDPPKHTLDVNWLWTGSTPDPDSGRMSSYRDLTPNNEYPSVDTYWRNIAECNGIRLQWNNTAMQNENRPLLGNTAYCGAITQLLVYDKRNEAWRTARAFAYGMGEGDPADRKSNTAGVYLTNDGSAGTGNTKVYETMPSGIWMNMLGGDPQYAPGWTLSQTTGRFYTASLDSAAASCDSGPHPELSVVASSSSATGSLSKDFFPGRIDPCNKGSVIDVVDGYPAGVGGSTYIEPRVYNAPRPTDGRFDVPLQSTETALITRSQMGELKVRVTNDTLGSSGNDFGIDNIRLIDITPKLSKHYVTDETVLTPNKTVNLVFTITNTQDNLAKNGWEFTESLPVGLVYAGEAGTEVDAVIEGGCSAQLNAGKGTTTLEFRNGQMPNGTKTCTITVPVKPLEEGVFTSPATSTSGAGTLSLKGLDAPEAATLTVYPFEVSKAVALQTAGDPVALADGDAVNEGDVLTYTLTFNNSKEMDGSTYDAPVYLGTNENDPNWVANPFLDYLGDVLDDADLLDANGNPNNASAHITGSGWQTGTFFATSNLTGSDPNLAISGTIPAQGVATVTFKVKVKPNSVDAAERFADDGHGYLANNFVAEKGQPKPSSCEEDDTACTSTPVRAWTMTKDSYPRKGETVHENGKVYYRLEIQNPNGTELKDVVVQDDLSQVLWAAQMSRDPQNGWGVTFYDKDGEELKDDQEQVVSLKGVSGAAATGEVQLWPEFYCGKTAIGTWSGWGDSSTAACAHPVWSLEDNPEFTPWNWTFLPYEGTKASWRLKSSAFTIPEGAYSAVVGYVISVGDPAEPGTPDAPTPFPEEFAAAQPNVPPPANASIVNHAWAGPALAGGDQIPSVDCSSKEDSTLPECTTVHDVHEEFFHIRKHGLEGGAVRPEIGQVQLLISDTYEEATASTPVPSKWLCHASYNPCGANGIVKVVEESDGVADPNDVGKPYCANGAINPGVSSPAHVDTGAACTGEGCRGAEDFSSPDSATYQSIQQWNAAANVWNAGQQVTTGDVGAVRSDFPLCGLMYPYDDEDGDGSWQVQSLAGGEDIEQWRGVPAAKDEWTQTPETQGTYWLVETQASEGYQLFAQPQLFWVAPDIPTPTEVQADPGSWEFFSYQGRLSFPVAGVGEDSSKAPAASVLKAPEGASPDLRTFCGGWCELPCSEEPPANNQPACISKNGWNMQAFNTKTHVLPLSGGLGAWWLIIAGGTLLGAVSGGALWRRRKAQTTSDDLEASASSDPAPGVMQEGEKAGGEPSGPASLQDMVGSGEK